MIALALVLGGVVAMLAGLDVWLTYKVVAQADAKVTDAHGDAMTTVDLERKEAEIAQVKAERDLWRRKAEEEERAADTLAEEYRHELANRRPDLGDGLAPDDVDGRVLRFYARHAAGRRNPVRDDHAAAEAVPGVGDGPVAERRPSAPAAGADG